jgi:hypothetical protein
MTKDNVQELVCHICKGTGEMDSGGTYPWGEGINIPCECTAPPAAQRQWVGLTDDEMYLNCPNWLSQEQCKVWVQQIEAKLREKNATSSPTIPDALTRADCEGPEYTSGWNDCRAEMMKGMK